MCEGTGMMSVNKRLIHGSFAYLLYLMDENEEAKKYIDIQLGLDELNNNPRYFAWFYYGLIVEENKINH